MCVLGDMSHCVALGAELRLPFDSVPVMPDGAPIVRALLDDPTQESGANRRRPPHLATEVRPPQRRAIPSRKHQRTRIRPFIGHRQEAVLEQLLD